MRRDRAVTEAEERIAAAMGEAADGAWMRRAKRRARWEGAGAVAAAALALAFLVAAFLGGFGCAHVDKTPANNNVVVIDEPADGCVARAIAKLPMSAITVPGFPILVFDGKQDQCRLEHEDEHRRQQRAMGEPEWLLDYGQQWASCTGRAVKEGRMLREPAVSVSACYLANTWEAMAFAVQDACADRLGVMQQVDTGVHMARP